MNTPSFQRAGLLPLLVLSLSLLITAGCSHRLEVKNISSYRNLRMNPLQVPLTIGVVPTADDIETQRLMRGVGDSLQKYSARVMLPYTPTSPTKADVIANITILPEYRGSGLNFLINWPGFLVWAPAWNGYIYKANYDVGVTLTRVHDNSPIDSWNMPIQLDIRHAEFDRTWTEIGWLEFGITPFIGGLFFIRYDPDVTRVLMDNIEGPIGDYIAQELVTRINNNGGFVRSTLTP